MDPDFVEREYNNRALVPDHPAFFERWERDSKYVRATLAARLDVPYGSDPRHRVDLFPADGARGTLVFVPAVSIEQIVDDVVMAMNWLFEHAPAHGLAMERVAVTGHSAGGHLVAALFATPRNRLRFDPARIVGGIPMSGVFDFEPLRLFSFNTEFRLDPAAVARLNLADKRRTVSAPLVIAAGAEESSEFRRQSRALADAWRGQVSSLLMLPGLHHFSIVDALAERGQPLHDAALGFFK
jgi:arylformamidase